MTTLIIINFYPTACVDIGGKCGDEIFEADFCSDGWTWDYGYVCDPSYLNCCKPPSSTSDSDDLSGDVETELTTASIPVREDFTTVSPCELIKRAAILLVKQCLFF